MSIFQEHFGEYHGYLGLLVYHSAKTSRHRQNVLSYVPNKILTWMLREATRDLRSTVRNRITTRLFHYPPSFLFFSVSFKQSPVFAGRLCLKACQHILDIVDLGQTEAEEHI